MFKKIKTLAVLLIYNWNVFIRLINLKERIKPGFLIIGVQKGGTSSLFSILSDHPQIKPPFIKEIHYFDNNFYKSKKWYLAHFPVKEKRSELITGEASPYYFYHPEVPKRIKKEFPDIKLILILRNPSIRAYSHYQMEFRRGDEKETDFLKAIKLENDRLSISKDRFKNPRFKSFEHQHFSYFSRGLYYDQLVTWYKYFDKKQILILFSEQFFSDYSRTLEKIYEFLEVEPNKSVNNNIVKNVGNYKKIPSEHLKYLNEYFYESNKKLEKLLSIKLEWNNQLNHNP